MALEKLFRAAKENDVGLLQEAIKAGDDVNVRDDEGKTALILAVEKNCAEIVKALVARKKDVVDDSGKIIQPKIDLNAKDSDGNTALILAVEKNREEIVQALIDAKAEVNAVNDYGQTALMLAAKKGHLEVVQELMKAGADVTVKCRFGETALMMAAMAGYAEVVEELLTDKRLHPDQAASSGHQALMRAAAAGHAEVVEKLLADKRANPELRPDDCYGCTALMVGAEAGHAKVVEKLLADKRVNPNAKSGSGKTALMFAAEKGHADVVQELIKAGAEVDIAQMLQVTSNEGLKQKIVATEELFKAVEENNVELLNESIKAEAYVDAVLGKYHCTPLVLAAEQGYAEIVKVLIEAGADVNVRDKEGKTALILAVEEDHANVVQKLIAMKYDVVDDSGNIIQPKIDLNAKYLGKTALMLAVEEGHEEVVKVLIENLPEDSRVENLNKALVLAKDDSIKSLLKQHVSNATPKSVRVNAEVSGTGSGSLGASKNETSKGAPSYPKTQLALCLASAAAFTSGAYFLLAQSAVSTMMWGPVPVLYLALVGCAAVGALLAWGLTTAYKDGFNDVAHSFYNWLGIDQDGPDAITVGS